MTREANYDDWKCVCVGGESLAGKSPRQKMEQSETLIAGNEKKINYLPTNYFVFIDPSNVTFEKSTCKILSR